MIIKIKKFWESFLNWVKTELVKDVSDMVDIDGDKPDYEDCGIFQDDDDEEPPTMWNFKR